MAIFFPCRAVHAEEDMDMDFTLRSEAFDNERAVPREYTCDGSDISPPLAWSAPPSGTKSLALTAEDPDAPMGTFAHWVVYDIPAGLNRLGPGVPGSASLEDGTKQGVNGFGRTGYGGPCPPRGHGDHRYFFVLRALDVETLGLPPKSSNAAVEKAMEGHVLGEARLMGTYGR